MATAVKKGCDLGCNSSGTLTLRGLPVGTPLDQCRGLLIMVIRRSSITERDSLAMNRKSAGICCQLQHQCQASARLGQRQTSTWAFTKHIVRVTDWFSSLRGRLMKQWCTKFGGRLDISLKDSTVPNEKTAKPL